MKMRFIAIALILFITPLATNALADGGTVRFMDQVGDCRITVFTSPTPFRAGPVDVSVFVQDAKTGEPIPEARINVLANMQNGNSETIWKRASTEAATNKLLQAAQFNLPQSGKWELRVNIATPKGSEQVRLELDAAEPLPDWRSWWIWLAWPIVPITLFVVHQFLVTRRERASQKTISEWASTKSFDKAV